MKPTRLTLLSAGLAFAAGCAAVSQLPTAATAPIGLTGDASLLHQVAPGVYPSLPTRRMKGFEKGLAFQFAVPKKKTPFNFIFASDNEYGNLDVFSGAPNPSTIASISGWGGWGLASSGHKDFATFSSNCNCGIQYGYITETSGVVSVFETNELVPSGAYYGDPTLGIAIDKKGDVYAGNWPTNCIDLWKASSIARYRGYGIFPDATFCSSQLSEIYYLGAGKDAIYATGWVNCGSSCFHEGLDAIRLDLSGEQLTQSNIVNASGCGFPGGVAVTDENEVYVDNQCGTITGYKKGKGNANQSIGFDYPYDNYSQINLDSKDKNLWAADRIHSRTVSYSAIAADSVPLGSGGRNSRRSTPQARYTSASRRCRPRRSNDESAI